MKKTNCHCGRFAASGSNLCLTHLELEELRLERAGMASKLEEFRKKEEQRRKIEEGMNYNIQIFETNWNMTKDRFDLLSKILFDNRDVFTFRLTRLR